MPELPDIVQYLEALSQRINGVELQRIQITSPFLLRTAEPSLAEVEEKQVLKLHRLGKRICLGLADDYWLVLHLMIAGRLQWDAKGRRGLASFHFETGTLTLTEAGTQRRASLHLIKDEENLRRFDPGGMEVLEWPTFEFPWSASSSSPSSKGAKKPTQKSKLLRFSEVLRSENHTLKRALTDPRLFSGIGNAYSDEILWEACLSPVALSQKLTDAEVERLYQAIQSSMAKWIATLRAELKEKGSTGTGLRFPVKVTAFRPEMAVHGKYREACPRCGALVQRIRYAANETNYCPNCQTGGKLLADRALSRLLRSDWPRTAEELETIGTRN